MLSVLAVPYVDSRAESLALRLGLPPQPALTSIVRSVTWEGRPVEVDLRVLGASHQVLVREGDRELVSETVACTDGPETLPALHRRSLGPLTYRIETEVRTHDAAAFASLTAAVLERSTARDDAVVGVFPGRPGAITAIELHVATDGPLRWRTWHCYPEHGQSVRTESELMAP